MADEKTDIRLVAAILTAGQLSRIGSAGGTNPDPRDNRETDFATAAYFNQLDSLFAEVVRRRDDPNARDY